MWIFFKDFLYLVKWRRSKWRSICKYSKIIKRMYFKQTPWSYMHIVLSFAFIVFVYYHRYTSIFLIRLITKMPTWVSKSLQGQAFYGLPFNQYFCYFSLIQVALGCLLLQEFSLQQDTTRIFRAAQRMSRCTYTPHLFHVQK